MSQELWSRCLLQKNAEQIDQHGCPETVQGPEFESWGSRVQGFGPKALKLES